MANGPECWEINMTYEQKWPEMYIVLISTVILFHNLLHFYDKPFEMLKGSLVVKPNLLKTCFFAGN